MTHTKRLPSLSLLGMGALLLASSPLLEAQRGARGQRQQKSGGDIGAQVQPENAGIAWFGTWDGALAEAKRTDRPILLMSAAPMCREVPGVW